MATWMVDRKAEESSTMLNSFPAILFPSSCIFRSLVAFRDTTAISVPAKKALTNISITCSKISKKCALLFMCC